MTNNLINLVIPFSEEVQEVENMLDEFKLKRSITFAEGAQLDTIGEIVGESRDGRSDLNYLTAIQLKIRLNTSAGKVNTIIEYIKDKTNSNIVKWLESYPAGVIIYVDGDATITNFDVVIEGIKKLLPAGVLLRSLRYVNQAYEPFALSELDYTPEPSGAGFLELGYNESEGYTAGALTEHGN